MLVSCLALNWVFDYLLITDLITSGSREPTKEREFGREVSSSADVPSMKLKPVRAYVVRGYYISRLFCVGAGTCGHTGNHFLMRQGA